MLIIETSNSFLAERSYMFSVLLEEFLGLKWEHKFSDNHNNGIKIFIDGYEQSLFLDDTFFSMPLENWLKKNSLPVQPLIKFSVDHFMDSSLLTDKLIPVIYGNKNLNIIKENDEVFFPIDIFGSCFFVLTRYEETVNPCCSEDNTLCDDYGCFRLNNFLAVQDGFSSRPLVDEYVEILWFLISKLWPSLIRKKREFKQKVTCDVDTPFDLSVHTFKKSFKRMGGDLIKRRSVKKMIQSLGYMIGFKLKGLSSDPYWLFDWMMKTCEQTNTQCSFYFITDNQHPKDGDKYWGKLEIDELLVNIHKRGHEIGLHGSYNTYNNPEQISKEFQILRDTCGRLNIKQEKWGGRQHYLRWKAPITWRNWESAQLNYDSTVSFTPDAGFRCGTCHPYPVFDIINKKKLFLFEYPLIVMECSIFSPLFQNLNFSEGERRIIYYKDICRKFSGQFTLLWHNSYFKEKEYKEIYKNILLS